jgi:hypothetical protein
LAFLPILADGFLLSQRRLDAARKEVVMVVAAKEEKNAAAAVGAWRLQFCQKLKNRKSETKKNTFSISKRRRTEVCYGRPPRRAR